MTHDAPGIDPDAIAIVGMACRFGPATSAERLWKLIEEGRTGIHRYTDAELIGFGHDPATVTREEFVPAGVVLEDADAFDAEFFGYSAQHAEWLDPQQRLLLEVAWHGLEDAGFAPDRTGLRTAVYGSVGQPTLPAVGITELDAAGMIRFSSLDKDFAASRVSYKLGLTGPSLAVQTACSSALVGVHLAAESLLGEECDLAVVAAASLHFPQAGYLAAPGMILSPTGQCRPFDDTADGTVFGNGGGALVLRRLADAVRDGDPVRAVLRGSAVNNDGSRKMDYHAPSPEGQEAVIREALAVARTDPHSVGYLETHGTGTPLGDPVEFAALERVYGGERPHPAAVGSVKSVLGHLNTAAGIAGIAKAVLALENATVPLQTPFHEPNRELRGAGGLRVADRGVVQGGWPVPEGPRRAAVSSFGIGGTNAHVVLEEAPPVSRPLPGQGDGGEPEWIVLSADTETALRTLAGDLAGAVTGLSLADVAHTLHTGRSRRRVRAVLGASCVQELAASLRELADGGPLGTGADAPDGYRDWAAGKAGLPERAGAGARRVPLPGYPFARTVWPRPGAAYTRTVRPEQPVAADHVVAGRPVLPAAAQLDLALTAARRAAPATVGLADVAFARPVEVTGPVTLRAVVDGDAVRVLSDTAHAEARPVTDAPAAPERIDPAALRAAYPDSAEPADLYRYFADHGVVYGPAFQVLRELRHGHEGALARVVTSAPAAGDTLCPYVLDGALQTVIGCVLREDLGGETFIPFAVDRLTLHAPLPPEAWVRVRPVRLAGGGRRVRKYDVTVTGPDGVAVLTLAGLALRPVPGDASAAGTAATTFRAEGAAAAPLLPDGVHLFTAETVPFDGGHGGLDPLVVIGEAPLDGAAVRLADPADTEEAAALAGELVARLGEDTRPPVVVWPLTRASAGPATDAVRLLALLRALLRPMSRRGARIVVPYTADPVDDSAAVTGHGIAALGRSLAEENPRFELTAVALDPESGPAALTTAVRAAVRAPVSRWLGVDRDGALTTSVLRDAEAPAPGSTPFRAGGRYWINGMGGLATHLAHHLIDTRAAHLVLTGRSAVEGERGADIARLAESAARNGGSVTYHRLDSSDPQAVQHLADRLHAEGPVHGVLHCAGTLRDAYVLRKDTADAAAVIAAKLTSARALDAATADWDLDFFVAYSSVSGALGSPGQADYSFANAAVDELVARRARHVKSGTRSGRSLSVGWPYWADGGMQAGDDAEQALGELGMRPMPSDTGIAVLEALLGAPGHDGEASAPVVLCGDLDRLRESFPLLTTGPATAPAPAAATTAPAPVPASGPRTDLLEARLSAVVAEATRAPVGQVGADRSFDDLGIDSLLAIRVVELLEPDFGRLSKTLLFECRTVAELAEHLADEYPERCAELVGVTDTAPEPPAEPPAPSSASRRTGLRGADEARRDAGGDRAGPPDAAGRDAADPDAGIDPRAVAIIGAAGRFPEADSLDELWTNLLAGRDSITEVPPERWDAEALYDADKTRVDRTYTKWGGFVAGVENFDAPLFSISPREAGTVDPQSRLFLESCWAALDDAGYTPDTLVTAEDPVHRKDVGVFVGAMYGEYQLHEAEERLRGNHVLANSAYWSIANRVSYYFDFQGPSTAVDTACSSALTSIHLAVESLRAGSSKVAIAGGVNVTIHPNKYFMLGQGRFAASDGRCRSFGAGGDGYVPGEGVGAFVLKPLADAVRDGDHVHGVIRGTSVNHGGRTNGYTVPNPRAQADLVTKALRDAGLTAADLDYLETHGTGTSLGDPIEVRGLASAFARDGIKGAGDLPIGSVKSNVGHLESAAGAVALAKVLLQMRHRTLVPSLHATPANPEIDFDRVPFRVQQEVAPWTTREGSDGTLRAGISSFGAGGANAHIVVEGPPPQAPRVAEEPRPVVVFLSARTETALAAYAAALHGELAAAAGRSTRIELADVAYTFAAGRADLECRAAVRARSLSELRSGLEAVAAGRPLPWPATDAASDDLVRVWLEGGRIDRVVASAAGPRARRVPLPHYPFERVRCWYDLQIERLHRQGLGTTGAEPASTRGHLRDFGRDPATVSAAAAPRTAAPAPEPSPVPAPAPPQPSAPSKPRSQSPRRAAPVPATNTTTSLEMSSMTRDRKISLRPLDTEPAPAPGPAPAPAAPAPAPAAVAPVPPAPAQNAARTGRVAEQVGEVLAEVLYMEPGGLDLEQTFQTLGVDSILSVEFVALVNARFGTDIKATELYDHPTPSAFARQVAKAAGDEPAQPAPLPAPPELPAQPVRSDARPAQDPAVQAAPAGGESGAAVLETLREQLAETLYCDVWDIDVHATFNTLGLDSILGVEFVAFLNSAYGLDEKAGVLYDHPSLTALATYVAARQAHGAPQAPAPAVPAPVAPVAEGQISAADLEALLGAVRGNQLTIEQALALLPQHS
ncbi:Polyketide synthase PksL [Streptomyces sp. YIM 130001]|uniref:beta-ketoacyl synthase N-terminal-like domain-containing protein n=1 Tax=Streptomyces sp. YIM 130001 TaxID=2259644 RepID=UPI000E64CF93|nr:beta-ketoacyl synthase N-terminal-like domain-containing protein [Streptomyces sp. YIM 130001]RII13441.1 Polyketide synthase PksL [Streptomyces sp. YIM 130001]